MKKSTLLRVTALSAALAAAEVYRFSFSRTRLSQLLGERTRTPEFNRCRSRAARQMAKLPHQTLELRSQRGERLKGFYYPCGDSPAPTIAFLVHGLHSEHRQACALACQYYHARGIDVFCCDNTAAGESEGKLVGYGLFERADCLAWLGLLRKRFGRETTFILHGFSMGGAVVLGMGAQMPEGVTCLVADSPFADAVGVLRPKLGPLYHPMRLLNRLVAGYDLEDTDIRDAVSRCRLPVLIIHGRADKVVPFSMGEKLFSLHPGPKDSLFLEGAGHVEGLFCDREIYWKKLDSFFAQYVKEGRHAGEYHSDGGDR